MKRLKFYAELVIGEDGTVKAKVSDYTVGVKPLPDIPASDNLHSALESVEQVIETRAAGYAPKPVESQPSADESNPS